MGGDYEAAGECERVGRVWETVLWAGIGLVSHVDNSKGREGQEGGVRKVGAWCWGWQGGTESLVWWC